MPEPKIISIRIQTGSNNAFHPTYRQNTIHVRLDDRSAETPLLTYDPHELTFIAPELVGLTVREAHELHRDKNAQRHRI